MMTDTRRAALLTEATVVQHKKQEEVRNARSD